MEFKIMPASAADAAFIADTVMGALGPEICENMAGSPERLPLVKEVFTALGAMETSQYSYRNTLIAYDEEGTRAGAVISYDGALLHPLRQAFIDKANEILGWNLSQKDFTSDETSPDEYYLDSLMVAPGFRRRGLGAMLIAAAGKKAREIDKPLGLLVDYDNPRARRLYETLGFCKIDDRMFAGVTMEHMQMR